MADKQLILESLLKDFELMRTEAREVAASHWKYSVPFALAIVSTFIAGFFKSVVFSIVPFFVLAQLATILNYHYGYICLLSNYIKLVERKINKLLNCEDLLEYENKFVYKYFSEIHPVSKFNLNEIIKRPQPFLEILMVVPSIVIYLWSVIGFSIYFYGWLSVFFSFGLYSVLLNLIISFIAYLYLMPLIIICYIYCVGFAAIREKLENEVANADLNNAIGQETG